MKITSFLNVEHGVFLNQLKYLERLLDQGAPPEVLAAVVETIAGAVESHRDVEERFLYPAVERAVRPSSAPIDAMEREHAEIERALQEVRSGSVGPAAIRTFADLLRAHIEKEIRVLFPLAEEQIPEEELVELKREAIRHLHHRVGVSVSR